MSGVNWILKLVDQFSSPAAKIITQAKALRDAVDSIGKGKSGVEKAAKDAQKLSEAQKAVKSELAAQAKLQAQLATFDGARFKHASDLKKQLASKKADALDGGLWGAGGTGDMVGAALGGAALGFLAAGIAFEAKIAEGVVHLLRAGAMLSIEATDFRSEAVGAFEKMLGSASVADTLYQQVLNVAVKTGNTKDRLFTQTRKLISAGFDEKEIPKLLEAFADLEKVRGEGSSDAINKLLQKIKATDSFDAKSIKALAKAGVSTAEVYDVLGKKLGKTRKEVEGLAKTGQIKGATGIETVAEVLQKKFGGAAQADSVTDLLLGMKTRVEGLFDKVDLGPLKGALGNALKVIEGPAGGVLKQSVTKLFGAVFSTLFKPFEGAAGQVRLEKMVRGIASILDKLTHSIVKAGPFLTKLIAWIADLVASEGEGGGGAGTLTVIADAITEIVDATFGLKPFKAFLALLSDYELDLDWLTDLTDSISELTDIGGQIIDGLVEGIEGNAQAVIDAVVGAVSGAINAAKAILKTGSPSKVFEELGGFTAEGYAQGVDDGAPEAHAAVGAMVRPPDLSGSATPSGGKRVSITLGDMNVTSHASDPKEVAQEVRREVQALFEEYANELGT